MFLTTSGPEALPAATLTPGGSRVFFAGDVSSIDEIQTMLEVLPICARGQVFVEVDDATQVVPIASPGRVTVTWLDRSRRSGRPGTGENCRPGEALDRAVRAWLGEFFVDRDALVTSDYALWIGGANAFAHDLRHDLAQLFEARDEAAGASA